LNDTVALYDELALGRRELSAIFCSSPPCTLKARGELLVTTAGSSNGIYHLRAGWACQFRDLANGRRAIVDVYLAGDVIGLDAVLGTQPLEKILSLTALKIEEIPAEDALMKLMAHRPIALYISWLLGQRQRRTDRLCAAISCLDARARLAMMLLDFYKRLRHRRLISGSIYNLPLTHIQIGQYLGLTVMHINRVLRALRHEQVVHLEKHCVTILDLKRLATLARYGGIESSSGSGDERSSKEAAD
jgi:CRP/FNR family transcriptional regulator, anaerobic regulatory protein